MEAYDCQRCGACCVNPPENVAEGYDEYVTVERDDEILRRKDLLARYTFTGPDGDRHMRLESCGRCRALSGKVGADVTCRIYHFRPSPCRRVQPGDELCRRYRRAQGLDGDGTPRT